MKIKKANVILDDKKYRINHHANKEVSYMFLIIIGIIGVVWFLQPVFRHFIWNIGNITGLVLFGLMALAGIFRKPIRKLAAKLWQKVPGKILVVAVCAVILCGAVLAAVETACMAVAAAKKPAEDATLVVLGCKVNGESPSRMLHERLEAAYTYLTEHPDAVCVVSGGQGTDEKISEAKCMYRYLTEKGIDPSRLYKEDRSVSTRENLAFSEKIIKEKGLPSSVAIVTNEFHEYRAGEVAKALEMDYGAVPAGTALYLLPTFYVRELYGILYEWVF